MWRYLLLVALIALVLLQLGCGGSEGLGYGGTPDRGSEPIGDDYQIPPPAPLPPPGDPPGPPIFPSAAGS